MKIAVLKETAQGETRCAAIPETVKKFIGLGAEVAVEKGAGEGAGVPDAEFEAAGAKIGNRKAVLSGAGIILCINGPDAESLKDAGKGAILVGALDPLRRQEAIKAYAKAGLDALAMVFVGAAKTLPKEAARGIIGAALAKLEREIFMAAGAEAKVISDGLHALSETINKVARTRAPLVPLIKALVELEDTCRATNDLARINAALAKVSAARELPRASEADTQAG